MVAFGSIPAAVVSWSDSLIVAVAPPQAASTQAVPIQVTEGGVSSNANVSFNFTSPHVAGVSPASGGVGTLVTVNGTGFGASQGIVAFKGILASVNSWNDSQIVATAPSGATTGPVTVAVGGLVSNNNVVFTMPNPAVSGISPGVGMASAQVSISGSGFGTTQGSSPVTFNGVAATTISWSDSKIVASAPGNGASSQPAPVQVTVGGVASNTGLSFSLSAPLINTISPASGVVGTVVTVSGTGFGASQSGSVVTFNGIPASTSTWNGGQIVTNVPMGTATGPVVVTLAGTNGLASNYNVVFTMPNPMILSVSPTVGPIGTLVAINGSGFGASQNGSTVTFNGSKANVVSWSDTQIGATVPSTAPNSQPIQVTVSGVKSNANVVFTTPFPTITGVTPTIGVPGTRIHAYREGQLLVVLPERSCLMAYLPALLAGATHK